MPKQYYAVYFCDPIKRTRTATLILDTDKFPPDQVTVSQLSRLFPYSEAPKMKRLIMMHAKNTWAEAWSDVQRLVNDDAIGSGYDQEDLDGGNIRIIAKVQGMVDDPHEGKLLAAAPELLQALEALIAAQPKTLETQPLVEAFQAACKAIDKAKGVS